jgi:hypothetical protein
MVRGLLYLFGNKIRISTVTRLDCLALTMGADRNASPPRLARQAAERLFCRFFASTALFVYVGVIISNPRAYLFMGI